MKWLRHQLARCWHRFWPASVALVEFSGAAAHGGSPLKVLSGVGWVNKNYLRHLLFAGAVTETKLGRFRLRKLIHSPALLKTDAALLLLPLTPAQHEHFGAADWCLIPSWLRGEIHLPLTAATLKHESVKADLRKIRQQEFGFEIARGGAAFSEFFYQMNQPYVRATHGDVAFTDWLAEHRRWLVDYEILFVHRSSEPRRRLAGVVIVYERNQARLWTLGVRVGHFHEVQNGVIAALYHFSFQQVQTRGFHRVLTGGSRAFLNDGILKFKRKMANEIFAAYPLGFALKIFKLDSPTRSFLLANPFAFQATDGLHAAVFTDTLLTAVLVQRWRKAYLHKGFSRLVIYTFCAAETFTVAQLRAEFAGQIEIRPATDWVAA